MGNFFIVFTLNFKQLYEEGFVCLCVYVCVCHLIHVCVSYTEMLEGIYPSTHIPHNFHFAICFAFSKCVRSASFCNREFLYFVCSVKHRSHHRTLSHCFIKSHFWVANVFEAQILVASIEHCTTLL